MEAKMKKKERKMGHKKQVDYIKKVIRKTGRDVHECDVEKLVDPTLHYSENKANVLDECGVSIGRGDTCKYLPMECRLGSNLDVCKDACKICYDPPSCEKVVKLKKKPKLRRKVSIKADKTKKVVTRSHIDKVVKHQKSRTKRARTMDARRTSNRTMEISVDNIARWCMYPGRYDLIGVDTEGRGRVKKGGGKKR